MKLSKFDLHLVDDEPGENKDATFTTRLPKWLKAELLKLPKKARNRKTVEFWKALVKENAS